MADSLAALACRCRDSRRPPASRSARIWSLAAATAFVVMFLSPGAADAQVTCTAFTLDSSAAAPPYVAGSQAVTISGIPEGCTGGDWVAMSYELWLTVSPVSGSGPGVVTVRWTQNWTSAIRTGIVQIAGNIFTVNQAPFPAPPVSDPNSDFDGDGWSDLVFRHRVTGNMVAWFMAGPTRVKADMFNPAKARTNWRLAASGDFNRDGKPDILWQEENLGDLVVWFMNGVEMLDYSYLSIIGPADVGWKVVSAADMNSDGKLDLVWQHAVTGALAAWYLDGTTVTDRVSLDPWKVLDTRWHVVTTADFDRDGHTDLLWKHATEGYLVVWLMNGVTRTSVQWLTPDKLLDVQWEVGATGDFNADGKVDLVFQHPATGYMVAWFMDGLVRIEAQMLTPDHVLDHEWRIAARR